MILLDFGGVMHRAIAVELSRSNAFVTDEDFLRHLVLSQIRHIVSKYSRTYGELVICVDDSSTKNWRKDIFPYYKASRKESRDASSIQWKDIYVSINKILDELRTYFPYKVITVPELEADDIISILTKQAEDICEINILGNLTHNILIVSDDKDFRQLHKYHYCYQYFPRLKSVVKEHNPKIYLVEHILKGDTVDGIPNIRSDADTFVSIGKRQKPVTDKFIKSFIESGTKVFSENELKRFEDNRKIIDADYIPEKYTSIVIDLYKNTSYSENQMKLLTFLTSKKLKEMTERIQDFYYK